MTQKEIIGNKAVEVLRVEVKNDVSSLITAFDQACS